MRNSHTTHSRISEHDNVQKIFYSLVDHPYHHILGDIYSEDEICQLKLIMIILLSYICLHCHVFNCVWGQINIGYMHYLLVV